MHLKIMWMNLASTNKDPEVVVKYYLDVVESIGGFVSAVIDETLDVTTYCRLSKNTTWDRKQSFSYCTNSVSN